MAVEKEHIFYQQFSLNLCLILPYFEPQKWELNIYKNVCYNAALQQNCEENYIRKISDSLGMWNHIIYYLKHA
jgi:hypothetical protein